MLAAGLIARQATVRVGRRLAKRSSLQIPAIYSYAIAGILAALARLALAEWTSLGKLLVWIIFGMVWGVVAGLLLPFARRRRNSSEEPVRFEEVGKEA